jgi:putative toxin-antitoxin system antitoxin component (TIGR02293 family)
MAERQHTTGKARSKGGKARGTDETLATPIAVAVGALVLGKMFGAEGVGASAPAQPVPAGSILAGLTDLIGKLSASEVGPQVNSWVGQGTNEPVQPGPLGSALGQNVLKELSQRTGMTQQEVLNRLATVLPQIINDLTPNGHMPPLVDIDKDASPDVLLFGENGTVTIVPFKETGYLEDVSTLLGGRSVLGSIVESELDAHELLHRGLPRAALSSLVDKLHVISFDEATEALGMSLRTLQRHKNTPAVPLDVQQSGRAWKFAEILAKATHVLGSQDEAEQWLKRPAIGLNQQRPVDLLTTPAGVKLVEDYLGRLEYDGYT